MKNKQPRAHRARPTHSLRLRPIAAACGALATLAFAPVHAQQAPPASASSDVVVITGIRQALDTSLTLKREARGLVDGIVAEDIGKFPDTNLAESMQRISGVAVERSASGEGSGVTVRGVGPAFNMVLLNGRQMPGALLNSAEGGSSANSSRAFDFANLSSDAISALEVYKTSRASAPAGGIGATINIKTARPLDTRERVASFGVKANHDVSNSRLPDSLKGSTVTPEVSGIYSETFADRTIGITISGSYSKRDSGSNKAYTQNGWRAFTATADPANNWGAIPLPGQAGANLITNRPTGTTLYSTPVELRYSLTGLERERTNGQATLQFAPSKDLKFTLDFMMANNTVNKKNMEVSTWFNFQGGPSSWTDGPVAGPISYSALFPTRDHDLALNGGRYGEKAQTRSTGFNTEWKVSSQLSVEIDAHHSTANSKPSSPYGIYNVMDAGMFSQGDAFAYYTNKLPVLSLPNTTFSTSAIQVTGTRFDAAISDQTIDQGQFRGTFKINADNKLNFGLASTKVNNRSANVNHQNADWGGVGNQGDYPAGAFALDSLPKYFNRIPGHDDPRLLQNFYVFDFNAVRNRAIEIAMARGTSSNNNTPMTRAQAEAYFSAYPDYSQGNDWRTLEKSTSAHVQWDYSMDAAIPMNVSVGLRYESTKVNSSSQVLSLTGTNWGSLNEINVNSGSPTFGSGTGKYSYVLPSIDWDADITSTLKVRASWGKSIARPGWGALTGGVSVDPTANQGGGTGSSGNPALKPLLSKNLDASVEWYYAKSSYLSMGLFTKQISNFIASTSVRQSVGGVHTPIGGAYYRAAVASGCAPTDPVCLRNYIFANFNGQPGVTQTGVSNGQTQGTIVGQPGDPLLQFAITTPSNEAGDKLKGVELNAQHMFGNSGFGVAGNYTIAKSGLKYDNHSTATQAALVGVGNSYNLVGFFENSGWAIRGAYNWRGEFLASTTDGAGNNPIYTEPYGQFDLSIGYKWNKNLTIQADMVNLTDGYVRQHGRTKEQLVSVTQTGARYQMGLRYKF